MSDAVPMLNEEVMCSSTTLKLKITYDVFVY